MTDQNVQQNIDPKILQDKKALEDFVDKLIKEKNSPYVNDANRQTVKDGLLKDLSDAINRKLIEHLTDEKVEELNKLLDANASDQQVSKFFTDNIQNMEEALTQVFLDFRKGYLSVVYQNNPPPPPSPAPAESDSAPVPNEVDKKVN